MLKRRCVPRQESCGRRRPTAGPPVANSVDWLPDGRFTWNDLMFEPKECIARLRASGRALAEEK